MKECTKKLLELIEILEELEWEYSISNEGRFEVYLGNTLFEALKSDTKSLQFLIDTIENW